MMIKVSVRQCDEVKEYSLQIQTAWARIQALSLPSSVNMDRLPQLASQFLYL